jgi:hypothetical protein
MPTLVAGAASSWTYAVTFLNGRMPGDELGEFTCLSNGGCITVDYIVGSVAIWQVTTHFKVIIDDTCYCAMVGDSD